MESIVEPIKINIDFRCASFDELKSLFYNNHELLKEYSRTDPIYHKIYQENQSILKQVELLLKG